MGCDIHPYAERRIAGGWELITGIDPFKWREYGKFGFLANVRNYSAVPPISLPRGLPCGISADVREQADAWGMDGHSHSWLSVAELSAFDYDRPMEDRRVLVQVAPNAWDGGRTAELGNGRATTFREFLGEGFFADLKALQDAGADRVVFWFDD